jgi:hypothetical protein
MRKFHIFHYFVLLVIFTLGLGAFYYVSPDTSLQFIIGIVMAISYVAWGLIHHTLQKDLHQKIVVEYILIGLIAVILLATILRT